MKYLVSFCLTLALLISSSGCSSINSSSIGQSDSEKEEQIITSTNVAELINIPEKIIYYHQGNQTIIDKNNDKFDKIVKLTKNRVSTVQDVSKLAFSQLDIEALKQNDVVLEFIYAKDVSANWKYDSHLDFIYRFNYNSIVFPLTGKWNDMAFFLPTSPGPLIPLESKDELLELLNH